MNPWQLQGEWFDIGKLLPKVIQLAMAQAGQQ
jgi:hypothetical protein